MESGVYQALDASIDFVTQLTTSKESFFTEANNFASVLHQPTLSGQTSTTLVALLSEFVAQAQTTLPPLQQTLRRQAGAVLLALG